VSYKLICPGLPGSKLCGRTPEPGSKLCDFCLEEAEGRAWEATAVYCSICDGLGHGQPGYGPCPLEETGWMEAMAQEAYEASWGVR